MKLGVSTACFYGDIEVEDTITLFNDVGIKHAEVFLNCPLEYKSEFIDELKKRKGALKIHSIHAHTSSFEPELFSAHNRTRVDAEETFRAVCKAGFKLGAKYYTFHGPFLKVGRELDLNFDRFSARVNELCEIASSYGIYIAYENVNWAYGCKPEFFTELLSRCPLLKTTLDIKQALISNIDPVRFLEAMGDSLVTVHLCDIDKALQNPMLPFKGRYNFEKFFKELKRVAKQEPTLLLEVYRGNFENIDELKECYDKMQNLIESIN